MNLLRQKITKQNRFTKSESSSSTESRTTIIRIDDKNNNKNSSSSGRKSSGKNNSDNISSSSSSSTSYGTTEILFARKTLNPLIAQTYSLDDNPLEMLDISDDEDNLPRSRTTATA